MPEDNFYLPSKHYLLSHSVGLALRSAQTHLQERVFKPWQENPEQAWPNWLDSIHEFQQALGRLFNEAPENFCPQANLSSGFSKLLHSLKPNPKRNVILLSEDDFPSMAFVAQQAQQLGWQLRFLPSDMDAQDVNQWQEQLKDDIGLVLLTHVYSNSSLRLDIETLCQLCTQRDILSLVDIAQSAGLVPIDLSRWQADFVLGSCVKWLCGGPGAGFLWVNPLRIAQCEPKDVGWFSHQNPFEFDAKNFRYHQGALRFWGGTPAVQAYALASHSIDFFCHYGVENSWRHNQLLSEQLRQAAGPACITVAQRGGTIVLKFAQQAKFIEALHKAQIAFDERPSGVRLSAHIYNGQSDIDAVINCFPAG